jgi:hypothetical protein
MIARKNNHDRIRISPRDVYQGRENCRSRAPIGRLHNSLRRAIRKAGKIVLFVRLRDRIQDLVWGHAPFRPMPRVLQERAVTEKRAELLRPIGSPYRLR